jgi:hypothetical protein
MVANIITPAVAAAKIYTLKQMINSELGKIN